MPEETNISPAERFTRSAIASYINGFLIVIVGFLIKDKLNAIETKLEAIDPVKQIVATHDLKININEKSIYQLNQELKEMRARLEELQKK